MKIRPAPANPQIRLSVPPNRCLPSHRPKSAMSVAPCVIQGEAAVHPAQPARAERKPSRGKQQGARLAPTMAAIPPIGANDSVTLRMRFLVASAHRVTAPKLEWERITSCIDLLDGLHGRLSLINSSSPHRSTDRVLVSCRGNPAPWFLLDGGARCGCNRTALRHPWQQLRADR